MLYNIKPTYILCNIKPNQDHYFIICFLYACYTIMQADIVFIYVKKFAKIIVLVMSTQVFTLN